MKETENTPSYVSDVLYQVEMTLRGAKLIGLLHRSAIEEFKRGNRSEADKLEGIAKKLSRIDR